jgi:hypothetical protein
MPSLDFVVNGATEKQSGDSPQFVLIQLKRTDPFVRPAPMMGRSLLNCLGIDNG